MVLGSILVSKINEAKSAILQEAGPGAAGANERVFEQPPSLMQELSDLIDKTEVRGRLILKRGCFDETHF